MGHSSPAAALRYQHVMAGRDQAIAAALDELVQAAATCRRSDRPRCLVARGWHEPGARSRKVQVAALVVGADLGCCGWR